MSGTNSTRLRPGFKCAAALIPALLLSVPARAQAADVTGWRGLSWGDTRSAVLRALRPLGVHECHPGAERNCAADELIVDHYPDGASIYEVELLFTPKLGLSRVIMFADDDGQAFPKVLKELSAHYGRPGLESGYDDREVTRTAWIWVLPHGKAILSSEEGEATSAGFTITYESTGPDPATR